jgi:hypothetical protein
VQYSNRLIISSFAAECELLTFCMQMKPTEKDRSWKERSVFVVVGVGMRWQKNDGGCCGGDCSSSSLCRGSSLCFPLSSHVLIALPRLCFCFVLLVPMCSLFPVCFAYVSLLALSSILFSFSFPSQWWKDERKPLSVLPWSALFSPIFFFSFSFFCSLLFSSLFCPLSLGQ